MGGWRLDWRLTSDDVAVLLCVRILGKCACSVTVERFVVSRCAELPSRRVRVSSTTSRTLSDSSSARECVGGEGS